jgi:hypothetical protein
LRFGKTEIFLLEGLDRFLLICPSGKSGRRTEFILGPESKTAPVCVSQTGGFLAIR